MQTHFGAGHNRIGAQLYLQKFYESFGFVQDSEAYDEDGILHIDMLRPAQSGYPFGTGLEPSTSR